MWNLKKGLLKEVNNDPELLKDAKTSNDTDMTSNLKLNLSRVDILNCHDKSNVECKGYLLVINYVSMI